MYKEQWNFMTHVGVGHKQRASVNVLNHSGDGLSKHWHGVSRGVPVAELTIQPPDVVIYKVRGGINQFL